jgi:transposase-like protein
MKFSEVMSYYNYNMSAIARALNISRQCIFHWRSENKVPYSKQCELEIITGAKLKANKEE